jgi:hypothetical protein
MEQRMLSEGAENGLAAPLMELSDSFMEQMELMAKELGSINEGIWALVAGVKKLTEAIKWMEKKEVEKVEKQMEMELEKERSEEEEEEDNKEEKGKGNKEADRDDEEDEEDEADKRDGKNKEINVEGEKVVK